MGCHGERRKVDGIEKKKPRRIIVVCEVIKYL